MRIGNQGVLSGSQGSKLSVLTVWNMTVDAAKRRVAAATAASRLLVNDPIAHLDRKLYLQDVDPICPFIEIT